MDATIVLYTGLVMDQPPQIVNRPPVSGAGTPVAPTPLSSAAPPRRFPLSFVLIFGAIVGILLLGFLLGPKLIGLLKKPEPVTLTYWGLWEAEPIIRPLIEEYQASHPLVRINYVFQSHREYRERLQNALAADKGPDIFRIHNTWVPMFKGDLSPVPPQVYSAADFESIFYPAAKADLRVGGNYVAVPLEIDGLAMFVNTELLSQANQSVPTTWSDLRRQAVEYSVCDSEDGRCAGGDKILTSWVALGTTDNVDHWQDVLAVLMLQNNVNLNSPSGKAVEDTLQYYTNFNRVDHVWDSTLPSSTQAFATGKLAVYFAPSWRVFDILAISPNLKFEVHPLPQLPIDPDRGEKPVTWASYWAEGVNKKSPNAQQAWDFVKFMSSPETLQKLYTSASAAGRAFGEPYGRKDQADLIKDAPYVGAYITQAPHARSWYMASFTHDGPSGINSRLTVYFANTVNAINQGTSVSEAVKTLNSGVNQVLSQYGLVAPAAVTP